MILVIPYNQTNNYSDKITFQAFFVWLSKEYNKYQELLIGVNLVYEQA